MTPGRAFGAGGAGRRPAGPGRRDWRGVWRDVWRDVWRGGWIVGRTGGGRDRARGGWRARRWHAVLGLALFLSGCTNVAITRLPAIPNRAHPVAEIVGIVDGDTVKLRQVSTGKVISARLTGFDTPETFRPGCAREKALGELAKARLGQLLNAAQQIEPRTHGTGKYGRLLLELTLDGRPLEEIMVAEGLAVRYDGGRRINWCQRLANG